MQKRRESRGTLSVDSKVVARRTLRTFRWLVGSTFLSCVTTALTDDVENHVKRLTDQDCQRSGYTVPVETATSTVLIRSAGFFEASHEPYDI